MKSYPDTFFLLLLCPSSANELGRCGASSANCCVPIGYGGGGPRGGDVAIVWAGI